MVVMIGAADVIGGGACQRKPSTPVFSVLMLENGLRFVVRCCIIEAMLWPSCPELHNCQEQVVLCCPDVT